MDKINTNFPLKTDSLDSLVENSWKILAALEDFSRFYPFFKVSRPLCTQGVLTHAKFSNTWHSATAKGCYMIRFTPYKGHLPIADNLAWSGGVRNSKIPLYSRYDRQRSSHAAVESSQGCLLPCHGFAQNERVLSICDCDHTHSI